MQGNSMTRWYCRNESIAAAAALLAVALNLPVEARVAGNTITLGSAMSFTGEHAPCGIHTRNGFELAVKKINETGGVVAGGRRFRLNVIYYDDESTPARTAQLLEHLIERDSVRYVLGPCGGAAIEAAVAIADKHAIPMIGSQSVSRSAPGKEYKYLFTVPSPPDRYLSGAVALAAETAARNGRYPSSVNVAMAFENEPFSREIRAGVVAELNRHQMQIVIDDELPGEPEDLSATLSKAQALKPDLLLVSGHSKGAATTVRQIGEMQIEVPMIALTHCEAARIVARFGAAARDMLCATQWVETLTQSGSLFGSAADYSALFKETYAGYKNVPYQSAQASAAVIVWKDAFERADSFALEDVRRALSATDLATFYGDIRFSENGANVAKPMVLRQIQNGTLNVVAPAQWASHQINTPRGTE
jgi:branched-chain amino acid transport system substrate-binding protein